MATTRPTPWDQLHTFDPDERFMCQVHFNGYTGWEWLVQHRVNFAWHVLDSGLESTIELAVHRCQEALGQLYG